MIVFKDFFFLSVCPGLQILPKAERKKTGGGGEKEKKSEKEKLFC